MTSREYLFSLEQFGIKLGLDQIRRLMRDLERPDLAYRSIVVAGTNGKGSVTAMVERGLRAAGYRTGRYTSPHLTHIEERIAIDGQPLSASQFDHLADRIREVAEQMADPPSFFEATTALAAEAFRRNAVDVAVFEVGLGGRLDATNVLFPIGVAITAIDFDHEQYLGTTIEAIAAEKAGIIKPGVFCVLGHNTKVVRDLVEATCRANQADFVFGPSGVSMETAFADGRTRLALRTEVAAYGSLVLGLRGRHQLQNVVTAVRLMEELARRSDLRIPTRAIQTALSDVDWPARLELRTWRGRDVLIDGAHNPAGARALASYLRETYARPVPIVLGAMQDKNVVGMIEALAPCASIMICTAASSSRAASPDELAAVARRIAPDLIIRTRLPPVGALEDALPHGTPVVVAGSLYLAGEIRAEIS